MLFVHPAATPNEKTKTREAIRDRGAIDRSRNDLGSRARDSDLGSRNDLRLTNKPGDASNQALTPIVPAGKRIRAGNSTSAALETSPCRARVLDTPLGVTVVQFPNNCKTNKFR